MKIPHPPLDPIFFIWGAGGGENPGGDFLIFKKFLFFPQILKKKCWKIQILRNPPPPPIGAQLFHMGGLAGGET